MVLMPSLIDEECDRDLVATQFAALTNAPFGVVAIVPNTKGQYIMKILGQISPNNKELFEVIDDLRKGKFSNTVVINNRYDGIDLPDESCRVLVIDSLPYLNSYFDKYEEKCCPNSEIINKKLLKNRARYR